MHYQKQVQRSITIPTALILISVLLLQINVIARSSKSSSQKRTSSGKFAIGKLKDIPFKFPATFKLSMPLKANDDTAIILHKEFESGIFLAISPEAFRRDEVIEKVRSLAIDRLLPKESKQFQWKRLEEVVKLSKYELTFGNFVGFNGQTRFVFEWHHLRFKKKDFLVGNFTVLERGKEAEEGFKQGYGGMSVLAVEASIALMNSITGEKIEAGMPGGPPAK
jgi:hypothetical protein